MKRFVLWALLSIAIAGCGGNELRASEDCTLTGDEDGNGTADCDDPVCAEELACRPGCGNSRREAGEACDDGNGRDGDGCDSNCTITACGNGIKIAGEACDDGNAIDTDDCRNSCKLVFCGDGVAATGATDSHREDCDGAPPRGTAPVETATCNIDCTAQACGDGKVNLTAGEECDDGNASNTDACTSGCHAAVCGDGFTWNVVEQCDDGNAVTEVCAYGVPSCTVCNVACAMVSGQTTVCGDGIVQSQYEACDDGNATNGDWCNISCTLPAIGPPIYIKASNPGAPDLFSNVVLSADGSTLAVGAPRESSAATGINGNQANDAASWAGAVYIFVRSGTTWVQQAYVKASNTGATDSFGASLALSADGSTLAVGADDESSAAVGINGNQTDNSASSAGAVYVFTRSGATWSQQAYLKASNTGTNDYFGGRLTLSGDGSTLAVGAYGEDSAAVGINGDQADNSAPAAGAVYVFTRSGATWSQRAYLKASNTEANDFFGTSVRLSLDGSTLAVAALYEASAAMGIGGDQAGNFAPGAGAVYVFLRSGTTWSQQAYVKASNTGGNDFFGGDVALSSDGSTLVVSACYESSSATGIGGNQADNSAQQAGAVYVFTRSGATWSQQAYVKASNTNERDSFCSLALSGDGSTLAVAANREDSAAIGIGGSQGDNSAPDAGAVYMFIRNGTTWGQQAYVKASNTQAYDEFARVALSADGRTLAVGARGEDGGVPGVGGNQADNSVGSAGAVYVFR